MNDGNVNNGAEGEESTTPTITGNTAGNTNGSSLMSSITSTLLKEEMVSTQETTSVKASIQNDSFDGTSDSANSTADATVASSPVEASKAGGMATSKFITADKIVSEREDVGITKKTGKSTVAGDTTTATLAKTTIKSKNSSTGSPTDLSKTKVGPRSNLDVDKSTTEKKAVKYKSGVIKTSTNTNSFKKEARKKRKTSGVDQVDEKEVTIPKKKKPKRKKVSIYKIRSNAYRIEVRRFPSSRSDARVELL